MYVLRKVQSQSSSTEMELYQSMNATLPHPTHIPTPKKVYEEKETEKQTNCQNEALNNNEHDQ